MERDFLGLNLLHSPKQAKDGSQEMYKHSAARMQSSYSSMLPSPPHQFLYPRASKEDIFFPFHIGCNRQPLSLAKNAWTLPFDKMPSSSSTNASETIPRAKNSSAARQCFEGTPVARPLSINLSPINGSLYDLYNNPANFRNPTSLTVYYFGAVHVFHDIPPEKAEFIMRVAGTNPMTAEAKEIIDQFIEENYGKNTQRPPQNSFVYCKMGGLAMARRATLARFLEKRSHRLRHARPYDLNVKLVEPCTPQTANMKMVTSP